MVFFNGTEAPELLPQWVVDIVWNQRSPHEDLCGERTFVFSLVRSAGEALLPALAVPYCVATPRTRIRRIMAYLVRTLDFDWTAPPKAVVRRPVSSDSLVMRLVGCCVAPASRGRPSSTDSWGSQSDGDGGGSNARGGGSSSKGARSPSRDRQGARGAPQGNAGGSALGGASGSRRPFGLRRGEDDCNGASVGLDGRMRVDGSPAPLASIPAQPQGAGRRGQDAAGRPPSGVTNAPDERCVEILCNDYLLDPDMSLATVRDFVWRRSFSGSGGPPQELLLCYQRAPKIVKPASPPTPVPLMPGGKDSSVGASLAGSTIGVAGAAAVTPAGANPGIAGAAVGSDNAGGEDVASELKPNGADAPANGWAGGADGSALGGGHSQDGYAAAAAAPPREGPRENGTTPTE